MPIFPKLKPTEVGLAKWASMPLLSIDGFVLEYHGFTSVLTSLDGLDETKRLYGSQFISYGVDAWVMELSDSCKLAGTCKHFCHITGVKEYVEDVLSQTCVGHYDCKESPTVDETGQDCCCPGGDNQGGGAPYKPGEPYCTPCPICRDWTP
jgi:hypothetical protein